MEDATMDVRPKYFIESTCRGSCPIRRLTSAARIVLAICVAIITAGLMCLPVRADLPMSEYITIFFELEGKPYDRPVRFHITCYGYSWDPGPAPPTRVPGSYEPTSVYAIRGNCPHYGCKISHNVYLNYIHIDYCDLEAETESQHYTLSKFASAPVDMSTCNGIECSLRVDLVTSAVLPVSPAPPPSATPSPAPAVPSLSPSPSSSATPSPAPTAPSLSPTPPAGAAPSPFQTAYSRAHEEEFLIALFFTLLIEVPILFAMVRFAFGLRTIGSFKLIISGVLASSLTLPYLWFIAPAIVGAAYALIIGEILVFLVEAGIYILVLQISVRRALLVSFIANLASLAFGLVLL
jgi:hypothetical protein